MHAAAAALFAVLQSGHCAGPPTAKQPLLLMLRPSHVSQCRAQCCIAGCAANGSAAVVRMPCTSALLLHSQLYVHHGNEEEQMGRVCTLSLLNCT
jgi:hypothetical protein